jgi:hypothetical protein
VPDTAHWCSLCYADLRPAAPAVEPALAPATEPAPALEPAQTLEPALGRQPLSVPGAPPAAAAPGLAAPVLAPSKREARWPCTRCGASNPMSEDACTDCGAGFLASVASTTPTHLPLVGDVQRMSQAQRILVGAIVAVALIFAFLVVLVVIGHVF